MQKRRIKLVWSFKEAQNGCKKYGNNFLFKTKKKRNILTIKGIQNCYWIDKNLLLLLLCKRICFKCLSLQKNFLFQKIVVVKLNMCNSFSLQSNIFSSGLFVLWLFTYHLCICLLLLSILGILQKPLFFHNQLSTLSYLVLFYIDIIVERWIRFHRIYKTKTFYIT